jgi:hypothetical protein
MKIEKITSILQTVLMAASVVVALMFFFGGYITINGEVTDEPIYTNLLLNLSFGFVLIALCTTFVLAMMNFVKQTMADPKGALKSLAGPLFIIVIVWVAYLFADSTPLIIPGYDGSSNVGEWLVFADICLYTTYAMTAITALATLVTGIIKTVR